MTPPTIAPASVTSLLHEELGLHPSPITTLRPGAWSSAFGFDSDAGHFVIRFSDHPDDFDRDAFAARFRNEALPIPRVTHRGTYRKIHYAISERAPGSFIDDLDREGLVHTLPSLLRTLNALREADISDTSGYGGWDEHGNGSSKGWQEHLIASVEDSPDGRGGSWRSRLEQSPIGAGPFDRDVQVLLSHIPNLPEHRHVLHSDLLNFNVFVDGSRISGVIDWGCAMYGDFLYELAWFAFWWPWYTGWHGVDIVSLAREHYRSHGADLECFRERMLVYQLQIGLTHQAYHATTGDWDMLESVARRTNLIADEIR